MCQMLIFLVVVELWLTVILAPNYIRLSRREHFSVVFVG